ncbi:MAG: hypothetical protein LBG47_00375 [Prevotellaceae bacterium]|jgi:hypothetical protein|nr:hypothetical protein [Prevotellaceae bacterium]
MNKKIIPACFLLLFGGWLLSGCSKPAAPSIAAEVQTLEMPAAGGEVSVSVSANKAWTVTGNEWITATKADDHTLTLQVAPNRQTARSATIVCVAETAQAAITVWQREAVTPAQSDSLALVEIYRAGGGDKWTHRWYLSQSLYQWAGVTTDSDGRVVGLNLSNNNLSGAFSEDLCLLDKLQSCLLNDNRLTGAIPDGLNRLTQLQILDLSNNSFTGSIPSMEALIGLRMLDLSENSFEAAAMPAFLASLTQLEDLRLKRASLTGQLPAGLRSLTKLHTLDLSYNALTGEIPDWSALTSLRVLYIYHAGLSGSIPAFIASLPKLEWLALDNNRLTGAIPNGSYPALAQLWLNNNNLTGAIPAAIKANPSWSAFHVCSGNSLTDCSGDSANAKKLSRKTYQ